MKNTDWEFRNLYRYWNEFGYANHSWRAVGRHIALEFHCAGMVKDDEVAEFHGGVEIHHREPPSYMTLRPPTHDACAVLGGAPCWHDGSSTWATEEWIPRWLNNPNDHDFIFKMLNEAARSKTNDLLDKIENEAEES